MTTEGILEQLRKVKYPGFSRDIVSFGLVKSASLDGGVARVSLAISTSDPKVPKQLRDDVERALLALAGVTSAAIEIAVQAPKAAGGAPGLPPLLGPVRTGNAFEETVERLLAVIKLGLVTTGDRFPAERELSRICWLVSRKNSPAASRLNLLIPSSG